MIPDVLIEAATADVPTEAKTMLQSSAHSAGFELVLLLSRVEMKPRKSHQQETTLCCFCLLASKGCRGPTPWLASFHLSLSLSPSPSPLPPSFCLSLSLSLSLCLCLSLSISLLKTHLGFGASPCELARPGSDFLRRLRLGGLYRWCCCSLRVCAQRRNALRFRNIEHSNPKRHKQKLNPKAYSMHPKLQPLPLGL